MTRKAPKQTGAHQKQLGILAPTCAMYELRYLCLHHEMQVPVGDVSTKYVLSNTRRQSTGKLNAPDSGQDVIPHYLRASTGSCHDFCKYGRKHSSEAKPWHPLSKRKNKLPADEQSPARTLGGGREAKRGLWSSKSFPLLLGVYWERKRR
ncbi:hypothetical protein BC332_32813 [Capsicum chinense]|nr:hypothetical protein BC332_32813 [Capsicum chinense]